MAMKSNKDHGVDRTTGIREGIGANQMNDVLLSYFNKDLNIQTDEDLLLKI